MVNPFPMWQQGTHTLRRVSPSTTVTSSWSELIACSESRRDRQDPCASVIYLRESRASAQHSRNMHCRWSSICREALLRVFDISEERNLASRLPKATRHALPLFSPQVGRSLLRRASAVCLDPADSAGAHSRCQNPPVLDPRRSPVDSLAGKRT